MSTDPSLVASKSHEVIKLELEIATLKQEIGWRGFALRLVPVATALLAVVGFLVGVHENNVSREKEFKKQFWDAQLRAYVDISATAATLATLPPGSDRESSYRHFLSLYHGELVLFEDKDVVRAVTKFSETYIDYERDPALQAELQRSARELSRTCRESLSRNWDKKLKELEVDRY